MRILQLLGRKQFTSQCDDCCGISEISLAKEAGADINIAIIVKNLNNGSMIQWDQSIGMPVARDTPASFFLLLAYRRNTIAFNRRYYSHSQDTFQPTSCMRDQQWVQMATVAIKIISIRIEC